MRGGGFTADTISLLSSAKSRSVSPENVTGEKGGGARAERGVCSEAARGLGRGWKLSPCVAIEPGETRLLADIEGPGRVQTMCIGRQALGDGARLKGRFIKRWGDAGLSDAEFAECLRMLDEGVPVAIGRDHSMALVGYRLDAAQPGGGVAYFRNSYGTDGELAGYQEETFEHVKRTVLDAYVYET